MGMHRCPEFGVVPEHDANRVANLRANEWTQESEMLPFSRARLQCLECDVGILAVQRLSYPTSDHSGARLHEHLFVVIERTSVDEIGAAWRVVPVNLVGRDVIAPCD